MPKFSLAHVFLVVFMVALLLGLWNSSRKVTALRSENDVIEEKLRAAKMEHVQFAQDPVAKAIRLLAKSRAKYGPVLFSLIARWGELSYERTEVVLEGQLPGKYEITLFHSDATGASSGAEEIHNSTIAVLQDKDGRLIDAAMYDSDLTTEQHSSRLIVVNGNLPYVRLNISAPHSAGTSSYTTQSWIHWFATDQGFSQQSGISQAYSVRISTASCCGLALGLCL